MEFKLHKDFTELDAQAWNALLTESITDAPFLRYEYLDTWWEHLGGGEWKQSELLLISASENGKLVGIAPLFRAEHDGRPALMLVGSIEISDYLDLIVRPADHPRFVNGLLDYIESSGTSNWRALDWYNLPDSSPTLTALRDESEKRGWVFSQEIYRPTPYIPLSGSFESYLAGVEKKQRHEIRRKMRRAAEGGKNVRFYVAGPDADIEADINDFFRLMAQDPNKADFLHPAMRAQMTATLHRAHEHGYLWLGFLEVDGVRAAASVNFDYGNKLWGYNSGVGREHMELSPGWVLLSHVIQWCCENRRAEFDFMRGGEEYKYRFGAVDRFVLRARVIRHL
jgi:CelD/BcsL family acetyltransferase involved in cellulose biosynthesis